MGQNEFERIRIIVRGRVQGVGFRHFAYRQAQNLGIGGWVRNNPDSSVEIEAFADVSKLRLFISELHKGPFWCKVDDIEELLREPISHLPDGQFTIK